MKSICIAFQSIALGASLAAAMAIPCAAQSSSQFIRTNGGATNDVIYSKSRIVDNKGKEAEARLAFRGSTRTLAVLVADHPVAQIGYDSIEKFTYDFSKHHRVKQGAIVMVASLGAGAIVMMTSSKSHWFTIEYKDGTTPKSIVLKIDKKEYKNVLRTAKEQTGKPIDLLRDPKL